MKTNRLPAIKDLVLVGGGHSHVAVLKAFGMKPVPGARLTVICRDMHAPYSGMLPGYIAGHYSFDDAHIDLVPLARFAGARLLHDEAVGLDLNERRVLCRARPPVEYDLLSLDIGAAPDLADVPGAAAHAVPVKPIDRFTERWAALRARVCEAGGGLKIAVVGGGAGGVELSLAIDYRLRRDQVEGAFRAPNRIELFTDGPSLLPTHNRVLQRKFTRILAERAIALHTGHRVTAVEAGGLVFETGVRAPCDVILWVTEAAPAAWLKETGLKLDARGFIELSDALQSVSHPEVFAAGDVAAMVNHPRPKAGVFAVRQGKPLARNLRRALRGQTPRPFAPQSRFLSLISTGDRYAVASRGRFAWEGAWVWRWKNRIDEKFMRKYNELPEMPVPEGAAPAEGLADADALKTLSAIAMRCGGCGAKIGSDVLERALARIETVARDDVLVGLDAPDDAAVVSVPPGKLLVQTVDFFRAFIDDPYVFGQVAATHALSDIYAMNAEPQTALAIAGVPYGLEAKVEEQLYQMMAGALSVLNEAGAALVGGHSCEAEELQLGFAVNGLADEARILRKSGLRPGEALILTKPVGTGVLFAAEMRGKAKGRWIEAALKTMVQSNRTAVRILFEHGASACTDVTGFGLLGHLAEMTRASETAAELMLDAIPQLPGAVETVQRGIFSSLQPQNLRLRRSLEDPGPLATDPRYALLFDPQTSGGLLAGLPDANAEGCLKALAAAGYDEGAIVGRVLPLGDAPESIHLVPA